VSIRYRVGLALTAIAVVVGTIPVGPPGDPGVAGAIANLRAIHSAQQAFASSCGGGAFAPSLSDLRARPRGAASGFIAEALGEGVEASTFGYRVTIEPRPAAVRPARMSCSGVPLVEGYVAHAELLDRRRAGPSFGMREDGAIFMRRDGRPLSADFEGAERIQ
jgi:hypothetical protein